MLGHGGLATSLGLLLVASRFHCGVSRQFGGSDDDPTLRTSLAGGDDAALVHGIGDDAAQQVAGADGVVVAGDDVLNDVGVAVGVNHGYHRHAELVGLGDGDVLFLGVDHEDGVRQLIHASDASEVALELVQLPGEDERFLLGHGLKIAGELHTLVLLHLLHPTMNGLEVGEHAAQPPLVDVRHTAAHCVVGHRILRLLLGAHEQHRAALTHQVADVGVRRLDASQRLVEIDDVDAVALTKDESLHLWVPAAGLVSEMDAGLEQLAHADNRRSGSSHEVLLSNGWCSGSETPEAPCETGTTVGSGGSGSGTRRGPVSVAGSTPL